jgi:hypothetical protein
VSKKSKKNFTSADICAYCNLDPSEAGEGDHVIPRCLFELPSQSAITVPACQGCNQEKSRSEDYVRDWLCSHVDVDLSAVPSVVYERFMRSAERGTSKLARAATEWGRYETRFTASGIYAGIEVKYPFEDVRVTETFMRVVQGLYFNAHNGHLPVSGRFEVRQVERPFIGDQVKFVQRLGTTVYDFGDGQCHLHFGAQVEPGQIAVRSLLTFYNDSVAVDVSYLQLLRRTGVSQSG